MEAVTETIGLTTYELTSPIVLDPATTILTATINANEPASSDATLSALTVSHGDPAVTAALAPAFAGETAGYTAVVPAAVEQATVRRPRPTPPTRAWPSPTGPAARRDGRLVPLEDGPNAVTVTVTAEDTSTRPPTTSASSAAASGTAS